ncbi:ion transporter [Puteibacter caeruleilacunae]|nr:ion transporter [Puteibacter caeruleilacunae]
MIKKIFLNNNVILTLILLNAVIIFMSGAIVNESLKSILLIVDNLITGLFVIELLVKVKHLGFCGYAKSSWNIFDFILIILSLPALIAFLLNIEISSVSYLLVFRIFRVFKTFRFIKFVPGIEQLIRGIQRALKASIIVLLGFSVYIFIIGVLSFHLFKNIAPEYFGNPFTSLYTVFKIFTVEGWFEIPEKITVGLSSSAAFFTNLYFIFILLSGGILGLSLVNSIFVDAMVSDNTDDLERKIDDLNDKINSLINQNNHNNGISE